MLAGCVIVMINPLGRVTLEQVILRSSCVLGMLMSRELFRIEMSEGKPICYNLAVLFACTGVLIFLTETDSVMIVTDAPFAGFYLNQYGNAIYNMLLLFCASFLVAQTLLTRSSPLGKYFIAGMLSVGSSVVLYYPVIDKLHHICYRDICYTDMVNRSITYVTKRSLRKMHRLQGGALWINAESVFPPFEGTCVVNQSQRFAVLLASLGDGFTTGYIDIHHRISNGPALVPGHPVDSHARSQRALNGSYVRSVNSFWNTDTPNGELLPSNGSSVAWGLTLFPPSGRSTASSSTTSYGATNDVRTIDRCIRRLPLQTQKYFTNCFLLCSSIY